MACHGDSPCDLASIAPKVADTSSTAMVAMPSLRLTNQRSPRISTASGCRRRRFWTIRRAAMIVPACWPRTSASTRSARLWSAGSTRGLLRSRVSARPQTMLSSRTSDRRAT
jgi:hypothetical protein